MRSTSFIMPFMARRRRIEQVEVSAAFGQALAPREIEVLRYWAQGLSYVETAKRVGISRSTVNCHLTRAFIKLGGTGGKAISEAFRRGLLDSAGQ